MIWRIILYNLQSFDSYDDSIILHQQLRLHVSFCLNLDNCRHNDHSSCTWSIIYVIHPSSFSFDMEKGFISYLGACDCKTSFPFSCLSWYEIQTLDSPRVRCHEVFGVLLFSSLPECILPNSLSNLGNLVRPLIVRMKDSQDGGRPFKVVITRSFSSRLSPLDFSLSRSLGDPHEIWSNILGLCHLHVRQFIPQCESHIDATVLK